MRITIRLRFSRLLSVVTMCTLRKHTIALWFCYWEIRFPWSCGNRKKLPPVRSLWWRISDFCSRRIKQSREIWLKLYYKQPVVIIWHLFWVNVKAITLNTIVMSNCQQPVHWTLSGGVQVINVSYLLNWSFYNFKLFQYERFIKLISLWQREENSGVI